MLFEPTQQVDQKTPLKFDGKMEQNFVHPTRRGVICQRGRNQLQITNYKLRILAHCMQHVDRIIGGVVSLLRLATKISGLTPLRKNILK